MIISLVSSILFSLILSSSILLILSLFVLLSVTVFSFVLFSITSFSFETISLNSCSSFSFNKAFSALLYKLCSLIFSLLYKFCLLCFLVSFTNSSISSALILLLLSNASLISAIFSGWLCIFHIYIS
mgnify:CR=1 FL=1